MSGLQLVRREPEIAALVEILKSPGSIAEVVAPRGMGKTSLLKTLSTAHTDVFDGAIEYFVGSDSFPLTRAVPEIAKTFLGNAGHNLLLVDDADLLDRSDTLEAINKLGTGAWKFSTLLAGHNGIGLGTPIYLEAFDESTFDRFIKASFGSTMPRDMVARLWAATRGNPRMASALFSQWKSGSVASLIDLADLLEPWQSAGLVGVDGRPLRAGGAEERRIITDVRFVSDDLLRQIADRKNLIFEISPRKFEEVVAELLERRGYKVTLTPATRDGGKDMYAAKRDDLGSFLYVVECKQHSPERPVGVGVVRALHGVAQHERVNAAILMTTSYFSKPAKEFASDLQYQISLKDYFDLRTWLTDFRGPPHGGR